jgi:hypothetical protein
MCLLGSKEIKDGAARESGEIETGIVSLAVDRNQGSRRMEIRGRSQSRIAPHGNQAQSKKGLRLDIII